VWNQDGHGPSTRVDYAVRFVGGPIFCPHQGILLLLIFC